MVRHYPYHIALLVIATIFIIVAVGIHNALLERPDFFTVGRTWPKKIRRGPDQSNRGQSSGLMIT